MRLTLELSADLERRLTATAAVWQMTPAEYALKVLDQGIVSAPNAQAAIELLRRWREEGDAEEQRETFEALKAGLDENCSSGRRIFPNGPARPSIGYDGHPQHRDSGTDHGG